MLQLQHKKQQKYGFQVAMKKAKYYYNKQSLRYEKIQESKTRRILRILGFLTTTFVFALLILIVSSYYFDSPEEKELKRELSKMKLEYELVEKRLDQLNKVLYSLQERDDNIYRVIFEAEPISSSVRNAGYGGVNKYTDLKNYENGEIMSEVSTKLDKLSRQLYIQSKSYDEITELITNKEVMLASIPAIQPVSNKDLTRFASGYGYRIHPIYKTRKMHFGVDFTTPTGTDIYCTGNGVVSKVKRSRRGFGNHVIVDHGFGYETLYAHMSEIDVREGQKVNRGDIVGKVGNTGTSTAPHLHYEVHKDGKRINPINFFYNDLNADEFELMIEISSTNNQSFD